MASIEQGAICTMTKGNIVSIEFTGKDITTGKIFDTTHAETAKKEGILNEKRTYGPIVVSLGMGEILPGLDAALETMKEGESKTVTLEAKEAFGERNVQLVRVVPLSEFKKNNVAATPGTIVNANDMIGKVQSVSGGRVRVDFNPDLAGLEVEYQVKVTKTYTKPEEKLQALVKKAFPSWEKPVYTHTADAVELKIPIKKMGDVQRNVPGFAKMVMEVLGVKNVNVTTVFTAEDFKNMHMHDDGSTHFGDHDE